MLRNFLQISASVMIYGMTETAIPNSRGGFSPLKNPIKIIANTTPKRGRRSMAMIVKRLRFKTSEKASINSSPIIQFLACYISSSGWKEARAKIATALRISLSVTIPTSFSPSITANLRMLWRLIFLIASRMLLSSPT